MGRGVGHKLISQQGPHSQSVKETKHHPWPGAHSSIGGASSWTRGAYEPHCTSGTELHGPSNHKTAVEMLLNLLEKQNCIINGILSSQSLSTLNVDA